MRPRPGSQTNQTLLIDAVSNGAYFSASEGAGVLDKLDATVAAFDGSHELRSLRESSDGLQFEPSGSRHLPSMQAPSL